MSLSWKDAVATTLVGVSGAIAYAKYKGFDWPLISSWHTATFALLVIGLATFVIIGSEVLLNRSAWITIASGFGVLAMILILTGIVMGNEVVFYVIIADIFVLWAIVTLHHLMDTGE